MRTAASVDWLEWTDLDASYSTVSTDPRELRWDACRAARGADTDFVPDAPMLRYGIGMLGASGTRVLMGGAPGMGAHVVMSGGAIRELGQLMVIDVLRATLESETTKVTRIDLAVDVLDSGDALDPERLWSLAKMGEFSSGARNFRMIQGSDGGGTFYLGAPSSDRMLRVYRKDVEQGMAQSSDWDRAELVLRRAQARRVARRIIECGIEIVAGHEITSFAEFPLAEWERLRATADYIGGVVERPRGDTRRWLFDVVVPCIYKLAHKDPGLAREFISAITRAPIDTEADAA